MSSLRDIPTDEAAKLLQAPISDRFDDDRRRGGVVGSNTAEGVVRRGRDEERQICSDHGALRFQPLIRSGWARQGIAYGPFARESGLVMSVSVNNGHNTSQATSIPESILRRIHRWLVGPNADPWPRRMLALLKGPRKKDLLRRFWWWINLSGSCYRGPESNDNLAVGWFGTEAPVDPLADGNAFIVHAAEGDNGELRVRLGERCLPAFRRLKDLQIQYVVALREQGAVYYAATMAGAHALPGPATMRPIAVDPYDSTPIVYAGVYQSVLGQIGFRADTRIRDLKIRQLPSLASFEAAMVSDRLITPQFAETWHTHAGAPRHNERGVTAQTSTFISRSAGKAAGLIHAMVEMSGAPGSVGLAWRVLDDNNYVSVRFCGDCVVLAIVRDGREERIATDAARLKSWQTYSVQILDGFGTIAVYLDGKMLFDGWISAPQTAGERIGLSFEGDGAGWIRDLEAHPKEVPIPDSIQVTPAWCRLGTTLLAEDTFEGAAGELNGRLVPVAGVRWMRTFGDGHIDVDGHGAARVRATSEQPHPDRAFHTLAWANAEFADLEVEIIPPGTGRGQRQYCRAGLVFWQDADNFLSFSSYLDDVYHGSSVALFTKRYGFEELYDAIWTMLAGAVDWGTPFLLRIAFDGNNFTVYINGEPVLQRALTDLYPEDPPLQINRVGLAINWEWATDTGSTFRNFKARA